MSKNNAEELTKKGKEAIKEIAKVAKKASIEGTAEYKIFIENHKESLKKLANK